VGAAESGRAKPHAGPHAARAEPHASPHVALDSRTQACTQVRTRPRRPARRPGRGLATLRSRTGRRSFPPPGLWKLTGCGKLLATGHPPPDLPTTVGNPCLHPPPRDSHSYAQPRRRGAREEEEKEENRKSTLLYVSEPRSSEDDSLPATRASSAAVGRLPIRPPAQVPPSAVRPAFPRPCWRKFPLASSGNRACGRRTQPPALSRSGRCVVDTAPT
jgi:hypothetical protein